MLVDGAILDVSNFSQAHPGGARLILNSVGTDVTDELLGAELSVGHAMTFSPFVHPEVSWRAVVYVGRDSLVGSGDEATCNMLQGQNVVMLYDAWDCGCVKRVWLTNVISRQGWGYIG